MTTDERNYLKECLRESSSHPSMVNMLSRAIGRAITAATTPEHVARLESLHKQSEDARQLLIATHDELAAMYQQRPTDTPAKPEG